MIIAERYKLANANRKNFAPDALRATPGATIAKKYDELAVFEAPKLAPR